jgi:hypothetical protein
MRSRVRPGRSWADYERVGEGSHERFVVDMQRFMGRIATKVR